jgi:VWA domain containing CoxE-like protein
VVDISGSTHTYGDQQIALTMKLYRALSTGRNRGFVVRFNSKIETSNQSLDPDAAEQALKSIPRQGSTSLYDAILAASAKLVGADVQPPHVRRAIFVISDGEDNSSSHSLLETIKGLQKAGIPVFPVLVSFEAVVTSKRAQKSAALAFTELSTATGGLAILPDAKHVPIEQFADLVKEESLVSFKIGEGLKPNKGYSLKIESPSKDMVVLAQKEYIAP